MSSRNRRTRIAQTDNPFLVDTDNPTFESVDRKGYGGPLLEKLDKHITAKPISIFDIRPDPTQPRRTVPYLVRQQWDGHVETLFETWLKVVEEERGDSEFDVGLLLSPEGDEIRNPAPQPIEAALLGVVDLAASIRRDGLTNPVTVVRDGELYLLETGERRWLAFHLLYQRTQDEQWSKIPARVMDEFSIWRQAGENNARDNLNAIGKARQLALLLMDLYRAEGTEFEPFDRLVQPGHCDRPFYAQIADGEQWRIPRGKAELLLNAIGLKSVRQLSQYRALLSLPDDAWTVADDTNLSEYRLRQILDLKLDEAATADLIYQAAQEFGTDSGTTVPVSERNTRSKPQAAHLETEALLLNTDDHKNLKQFISFARTVRLSDIAKLDSNRKQQILEWAQYLKILADRVAHAAGEE